MKSSPANSFALKLARILLRRSMTPGGPIKPKRDQGLHFCSIGKQVGRALYPDVGIG
jgi:hypothetical protein